MKVSLNFDVRELVHPDIYNHPAVGNRAADFLHPNLAPTLEKIKADFNDVVTVNNWHYGGRRKDSGLRSNKKPYGGKVTYSAHYFGIAADCQFKGNSCADVYHHILNNQDDYQYITRMENVEHTPTWLHIEVGGQREGEIITFNP